MFLVSRRRECAGRREWSSSKNAAVTLESLPEESGRNCCLSMLHGRETNLPCLSDITQIRCSFQETFRKLLRASLTSCAPGGPRYRFFVSRGTSFLFYLTRSKHSEASNRRKAETLGMRPLRGTTDARQRAFDRAGSTVLRKERPPKPVRVASQTSRKYAPHSLLHETRVCWIERAETAKRAFPCLCRPSLRRGRIPSVSAFSAIARFRVLGSGQVKEEKCSS